MSNISLSCIKSVYDFVKNQDSDFRINYIEFIRSNKFIATIKGNVFSNLYELLMHDLMEIQNPKSYKLTLLLYKESSTKRAFVQYVLGLTNSFISIYFHDPNTVDRHNMYSFSHSVLSYTHAISTQTKVLDNVCTLMNSLSMFSDAYSLREISIISSKNLVKYYAYRYDHISFYYELSRFELQSESFDIINRLNHLVNKIAIQYESNIFIYQIDLTEIAYILKYDIDNTMFKYYKYILRIEYLYYTQIELLDTELNNFYLFINDNFNIIGIRYYNGAIVQILIHYHLIGKSISSMAIYDKYITENISLRKNKFLLILISLTIYINLSYLESYASNRKLIDEFQHFTYFTHYSKFISLYDAFYFHLTGDYKESLLQLNNCTDLLADKAGYGMCIRILEIMNYIRWGKFEQNETALVNLKNQITGLKKYGTLKPRYHYIYKILLRLHNSGYNYQETYRVHKDKLRLMAGTNTLYAWDVRSPEMIRFDKWFFQTASFLPEWSLESHFDSENNNDVQS